MFRTAFRGLVRYFRTHLTVIAAVALAAAVISGALIVGDSIRGSLRKMTRIRLGNLTHLVTSPRFFRQDLAERLAEQHRSAADRELLPLQIAPAVITQASATRQLADGSRRTAGAVSLAAVDNAGWQLLNPGTIEPPDSGSVILSTAAAAELSARPGDTISLWVELPSDVPRDALLGEREEILREIAVEVGAIADSNTGPDRFSLFPSQTRPLGAYISLELLQERLGLEEIPAGYRNPIAKPARVNSLLIGNSELSPETRAQLLDSAVSDTAGQLHSILRTALTEAVTADDLGLRLRSFPQRGYVSVESDSMILPDAVSEAATASAQSQGFEASPVLVYLINEVSAVDAAPRTSEDSASDSVTAAAADTRYSMYSIAAALPVDSAPPLGPILLADGTPASEPAEDEVLLSAWLAQDLQSQVGDSVRLRWHETDSHGELPELEREFRVAGILAEDDAVSVDRNLTPVVEGITDVETFGEWDQPFPMDLDRVTDRDDIYWERHRATPKLFLAPSTAEKLWAGRYGRYTSVHVAVSGGDNRPDESQLSRIADRLADGILSRIDPTDVGLVIQPIRRQGLAASGGANDFSQLFLGFSFFLIVAALLLAMLMFRLTLQLRAAQYGLLQAVGWTAGRARGVFLTEGLLTAAVGALIGASVGAPMARAMLWGLTTYAVDAVGTSELSLHVDPIRPVTAGLITLLAAAVVIWWSCRDFRSFDIRSLLTGWTENGDTTHEHSGRRLSTFLMTATGAAALALPIAGVLGLIPQSEAFGGFTWPVVSFFTAGFCALTAGLLAFRQSLTNTAGRLSRNARSVRSIGDLAAANAGRNHRRSLLTTAMTAFAVFIIVAVAAGRRNPQTETPDVDSGNGGFRTLAEFSQPLLFDLNTVEGREALGFREPAADLFSDVSFSQFSVRPGQDASCANLFQATVPRLLGADPEFIERGGFRFAASGSDASWRRLEESLPDIDGLPAIPVIGDMNTLQYALKKGVGDTVLFPDEESPRAVLVIAAMLDGSLFQGDLVMTRENLKRIAPDTIGSQYVLIETPDEQSALQTASILETELDEFGADSISVNARLASFLAVQNTYLSTFMLLGGLGLLLGTVGLAVVMLRNVMERRAETALLRAVGFRGSRVALLLFRENSMLLVRGVLLGAAAALLAMWPHLQSTGADLPVKPLIILLAAVLLTGTSAAALAVFSALRSPVREALTGE